MELPFMCISGWKEQDADCVNGKSVEDDSSTYDVTVKLAGVASGN